MSNMIPRITKVTEPGYFDALNSRIGQTNIIDTGCKKKYILSVPTGSIALLFNQGVGYAVLSGSNFISVLKMYSNQYDTFEYATDTTSRTVTFTEINGGNVRFVIITSKEPGI